MVAKTITKVPFQSVSGALPTSLCAANPVPGAKHSPVSVSAFPNARPPPETVSRSRRAQFGSRLHACHGPAWLVQVRLGLSRLPSPLSRAPSSPRLLLSDVRFRAACVLSQMPVRPCGLLYRQFWGPVVFLTLHGFCVV